MTSAHLNKKPGRTTRSRAASPPGPAGIAAVGAAGVVGTAALVIVVLIQTVPRFVASVGPGYLSYHADLPELPSPTAALPHWLTVLVWVIAVAGPLVGFGWGYPVTTPAWRRRLGWTALVSGGVTLLWLLPAVLWSAGTGYRADGAITSFGSGSATVLLFFALVIAAAGGIMTWLSRSSDFENRSGEYFTDGSTVALVRPVAARTQWSFAAAVLVVWAVIAVPLLVRCYTWPWYPADDVRPWGLDYASSAEGALTSWGFACGSVGGVLLSVGVLKSLYRQRWRDRVSTADPLGPAGRLAVRFRHWPAAIATAWVLASPTFIVRNPLDDSFVPLGPGDFVVLLAFDLVVVGLMTWLARALFRRVGRVFDPVAARPRAFSRALPDHASY